MSPTALSLTQATTPSLCKSLKSQPHANIYQLAVRFPSIELFLNPFIYSWAVESAPAEMGRSRDLSVMSTSTMIWVWSREHTWWWREPRVVLWYPHMCHGIYTHTGTHRHPKAYTIQHILTQTHTLLLKLLIHSHSSMNTRKGLRKNKGKLSDYQDAIYFSSSQFVTFKASSSLPRENSRLHTMIIIPKNHHYHEPRNGETKVRGGGWRRQSLGNLCFPPLPAPSSFIETVLLCSTGCP